MIRTSPVEYGNPAYNWNSRYKWECTWYVYGRCSELGLPYPTWWDRATETGSYTDAKLWPQNYRDPWVPKDKSYRPVAHDIVIFNGPYGHVAFIEKVEGNRALLSQYMSGKEDSFSNYSWEIGTSYTGPLMGYLHCPVEAVDPVSHDTNDKSVDQILTTDVALRIRNKPTLNSDVVGHVQIGYYNVLSKAQCDGYTWYQIAKDRWCADITTKYLPASKEDDFMKKIEEYFNGLKGEITTLTDQRNAYKDAIDKAVKVLTEVDK